MQKDIHTNAREWQTMGNGKLYEEKVCGELHGAKTPPP